MMHPFAVATGVFDEPLETWRGNVGSRIHSLQFYETRRAPRLRARREVEPRAVDRRADERRACPRAPGAAVWGAEHHARVRERFGHCLSWGIFGEDLPDEDNRVTLDPALVDATGVPAPRVTYRASDNSRRLLDFHVARARESLLEAGATQRRHADPDAQRRLAPARHGAHGRPTRPPRSSTSGASAHDVDNLYVVDGSVFVTAGGVNPTNTICVARPALRRPPGRAPRPPAGAGVTAFDQRLRDRLVRIADGLIPATDEMPAPGEHRHRRPPARPRARVAARPRGRPPARARGRRRSRRPARLGRAARGRPTRRPTTRSSPPSSPATTCIREVQRRLGYPGQVGEEVRVDSYPDYVHEGQLERVLERGPIYRPTPG